VLSVTEVLLGSGAGGAGGGGVRTDHAEWLPFGFRSSMLRAAVRGNPGGSAGRGATRRPKGDTR